MNESENDGFIIKDDGTIVRRPKLEEFKKSLKAKGENKEEKKGLNKNDNNGCKSALIGFLVFVLITTIIGGVIGFFVDEHESIEMGLLLGGLFGIGYCICSLIGEFFNEK